MSVRYLIVGIAISLAGLVGMGTGRMQLLAGDPPATEKKPAASFRLVRRLKGHSGISALNFSPDGKYLASAGDTTIRLWDPITGKQLCQVNLDGELTGTAVFVQGGRVLACRSVFEKIQLLGVPSLTRRGELSLSGGFACLMPSPDGKVLAIGAAGGSIALWNLVTLKRSWRVEFPSLPDGRSNRPAAITFAPGGNIMAVGMLRDSTVRILDAVSGKELRRLKDRDVRSERIRSTRFSPDGRVLAVGMNMENLIRLWDPATGRTGGSFRWRSSPDPRQVKADLPHAYRGLDALAFAPDGKTLVAACSDGRLRFWEMATGCLRHETLLPDTTIPGANRIAFSPDGRLLATGSQRGNPAISIWDWRAPERGRPGRLTEAQIADLWNDLRDEDAAKAYQAIALFGASPKQAVDALRSRLPRIEPVDPKELDRLVANLDADEFAVRRLAFRRLAEMGPATEPRLRKEVIRSHSAEVMARIRELLGRLQKVSPTRLRFIRSVELLEYLGSPEACRLLQTLASGASGAVETEDAVAALRRLARHGRKRP